MKRAVNLRLDENMILQLNQLAEELHTTKTDIVEKAISFFSKENNLKKNKLLEFAGILKEKEATKMLKDIQEDKNSKDLDFNL